MDDSPVVVICLASVQLWYGKSWKALKTSTGVKCFDAMDRIVSIGRGESCCSIAPWDTTHFPLPAVNSMTEIADSSCRCSRGLFTLTEQYFDKQPPLMF